MPDNKDYIQYGDYRIKINRTLGARRTTLKVAASGITLTTSLFEPRYRLERFVEDNEEFLRKATRKLEARKKKSALIDFTQSSRGYLLGNPVDIVIIEKPQSKCYLEGDVLYIEGPSVNARQTVFKRFAQRILDNGHNMISTFGIGRELSKKEWHELSFQNNRNALIEP